MLKKNLILSLFLLSLYSCSSLSGFLGEGQWRDVVGQLPENFYDRDLSQVDYPFPVNFYQHPFRGQQRLSIAYMDLRPTKWNGRTMVLLHGLYLNSSHWKELAEKLREEGFRVVMVDQLGFGKSSKPLHYPYSLHGLAHITHDLLASLSIESFEVIGHCFGGMLGTRMALIYPEKVRSLVLVNFLGQEDWRRKVALAPLDHRMREFSQRTPKLISERLAQTHLNGGWSEDGAKSWYAHKIGQVQGPHGREIAYVDMLIDEMIYTSPVLYEYDLILAETLLIHGTDSRALWGLSSPHPRVAANLGRYDRFGVRTCNRIPRCRYTELNRLSHNPFLEDFDRFWSTLSPFLLP